MGIEDQIPGTREGSNPALGFAGKLINIFTSPTKTFQELDQRPTWIAPLLISVFLVVISTQISFPIIMSSQLEKLRSNPNIPPEQMQAIEGQFANSASTQRIITLVSQALITPIVFFALAGIFYLVGTAILGGDSSYKKVLAALTWANCISIIATIVTTALIIGKGSMDISLSPALLLPADAIGTRLHTFFSQFDFFTIWFLAVFALGFGYMYRFSMAKAYTTVGALWAVWIALYVALSGVLRQFGL